MIIKGDLSLYNCKNLISLGKLEEVSGNLNLWDCYNLKDLSNLEEVGRDLDLFSCKNLKSLGKLEKVSGTIYLNSSDITEEYVRKFKPWLLNKCRWD